MRLPESFCKRWRLVLGLLIATLCCLVVILMFAHLDPPVGTTVWFIRKPSGAADAPTATAAPLGGSISVNSAGVDELITLPGVGPAVAESIIEERQQNGLFYYPEDLLCVRGIGEKTLKKLLPYLNLD